MLRSEAKNSCPTCKNKSTGVFERYTPGLLSQSKSKLEIGLAAFLILFCSKHRPRLPGSGSHALHLPDRVRLARRMLPSELGLPLLRQRGPDDSWCGCVGQLGLIILLLALMWFVRLYLHYYSQWLYLQAIAVPVNKWVYSLWYHHECAEIHTRRTLYSLAHGQSPDANMLVHACTNTPMCVKLAQKVVVTAFTWNVRKHTTDVPISFV